MRANIWLAVVSPLRLRTRPKGSNSHCAVEKPGDASMGCSFASLVRARWTVPASRQDALTATQHRVCGSLARNASNPK